MLARSMCATVAALAVGLSAAPAFAETQTHAQFRTAQAQSFTADDLAAYGLDKAQTERAMELQAQGHRIVALTPEEAKAYTAGTITQTEWIMIGVGVLIILAIT